MNINPVFIGIALIIIGFLIIFASAFGGGRVKFALGGFIGPVPFGWANDPQMLKLVMWITIAVVLAM